MSIYEIVVYHKTCSVLASDERQVLLLLSPECCYYLVPRAVDVLKAESPNLLWLLRLELLATLLPVPAAASPSTIRLLSDEAR